MSKPKKSNAKLTHSPPVIYPHLLLVNMNPPYLKVEGNEVISIDLRWRVHFVCHLWSFSVLVYWLLCWPISSLIIPDTLHVAADREILKGATWNTIRERLRWVCIGMQTFIALKLPFFSNTPLSPVSWLVFDCESFFVLIVKVCWWTRLVPWPALPPRWLWSFCYWKDRWCCSR